MAMYVYASLAIISPIPATDYIMKKLLYIIFAAIAVAGCARTEHTEAVTAEIEAAQIEGREAARDFLHGSLTDTADMQKRLLKVRARSSKYEIEGNKEASAAFDTAFITTVRAIHPSLAKELQ